jgi:hypothetical protein
MFDVKILKRPALTGIIQDFKDPQRHVFTESGILPETPVDGDQISWDIEVVDRDVAKFQGMHSPAGVRRLTKFSNKSATLARTFTSKNVKGTLLKNLREPGSDQKMEIAESIVAREVQKFARYLNRQNEFMRASALQGSIAMTIDGLAHSVDYGFAAAHTPTAPTLWSDPAADIIGDLSTWKLLIAEDSGYDPTMAFISAEIMRNMLKNDQIMSYFASTPQGGDYMKEGKIGRLMGLDFMEANHGYVPDGGSFTRYLDYKKMIIVPPPDPEWGDFAVGTDVVPTDDRGDIEEVQGRYSFSNVEINPASLQLFAGEVRLPIIRNPNAIVVPTVLS